MTTTRVPLFPLNTVLYPGMKLPLRIFEERYHLMFDELLGEAGTGAFGVALTRDPEVGADARPRRVGCLARVIQTSDEDNVRFILAEGTTRFLAHDVLHDRPFAEAEIALLPEEEGDDVRAVMRTLRERLAPHGEALDVPDDCWPEEPCALSYLVAQALPLDTATQQVLLEAPTAAARLDLEVRLVARLAPKMQWLARSRNASFN